MSFVPSESKPRTKRRRRWAPLRRLAVPFFRCISTGDVAGVREALDRDPSFAFAESGLHDGGQLLKQDISAVECAVFWRQPGVLAVLLKQPYMRTYLTEAGGTGDGSRLGPGLESMQRAIHQNNDEAVKLLLEAGMPAEQQIPDSLEEGEESASQLLIALRLEHAAVVRELSSHGASALGGSLSISDGAQMQNGLTLLIQDPSLRLAFAEGHRTWIQSQVIAAGDVCKASAIDQIKWLILPYLDETRFYPRDFNELTEEFIEEIKSIVLEV